MIFKADTAEFNPCKCDANVIFVFENLGSDRLSSCVYAAAPQIIYWTSLES